MKDIDAKVICRHCGETMAIKERELFDSKQWIDLDIDNLPDRFFTRDDIEFQCNLKSDHDQGFHDVALLLESRCIAISNTNKGSIKYCYRIIEKEPIRIDQETHDLLLWAYHNPYTDPNFTIEDDKIKYINKHSVEVIDG